MDVIEPGAPLPVEAAATMAEPEPMPEPEPSAEPESTLAPEPLADPSGSFTGDIVL
jgi:hypothetical protein